MTKKTEKKQESKQIQILKHLIRYGSITSKKAREKYDCQNVSSVICRLRKFYNIETVLQKQKGGPSYAKYILKGTKKGK